MWPDALWVWTGTLYRTFCHHILTPHLFFCLFVFIFVGISPLCHVSLCCWASSKPKASWAHEKLLRWVRGGFPLLTCWQWGWECGTAALCSPTVDIYTRGLNLWYLLSGRLPSEKFLNVPKRSNRRTGSLYVCISMLAKCATNWSFKKQSKALSVLVSFFFFFFKFGERCLAWKQTKTLLPTLQQFFPNVPVSDVHLYFLSEKFFLDLSVLRNYEANILETIILLHYPPTSL